MKKLFLVITMLATINCMAQDAPVAVKTAFAKYFPGAIAKKWDKEDKKYEANFSKGGKTMSATFAADGTLEETETDIKVSELPASIINYVKANYKGATIKEAAMIARGNDKMYEAEVKGKDLLFDMNGKFLKAQKD